MHRPDPTLSPLVRVARKIDDALRHLSRAEGCMMDAQILLDQARDGAAYCVFGKVSAGQDVVDRIKGIATANSGSHQNVPKEDVVIQRAEEVA